MEWLDFWITLIKAAVIYVGVIQVVPIMLWVERRGAALIQDRPGPNRVGPMGFLQPVADVLKFVFKEDLIPAQANKVLYVLGPFLLLLPASLVIAAIPMGDYLEIFGRKVLIQIADLDVGILFVLGIGSLGIYGLLLGGWASNNKYSLLGSMRASSQMISYEVPMALAAAAVVLWYGTFSLREMVLAQEGLFFNWLPRWGIFAQPLGFLLLFVSMFAETNRLPFDLPEAEPELVAGYHTEYGSLKFAAFFMAEYINLFVASALVTTFYFGGWHLPWVSDDQLLAMLGSRNALAALQVATFLLKVSCFMIVFVWVRWTLPRFRFDQLMSLSWTNLIPLGILNLLVTTLFLWWRMA